VHETAAFLGHFHPVWVHMPIGILLLLGVLEVAGLLSRSRPFRWLPALGEGLRTLILCLAAAASVLAAALGWLLARSGDYDPALVTRHQWLGIAAAAAAVLVLLVHRIGWLYGPALGLSIVLLVMAAHAGGKITHGSDFLTSHMPRPLGRMLGIAPPAPARKPGPPDIEHAVAYADVIQPILQDRCYSCHGPSKSNGGLRVDTWDLLMKGGKHGVVVKPGSLASELVRRIDLPGDQKEHMPPRGKPQLADDDLTLLEWWVGAGAPRDKAVAALDLPSAVQVILDGRLAGGASGAPPGREATLEAAAQLADRLGILIRPMSPDGPWVDVNARPAGKAFGDGELAQLAPIAPAVQWLDLGNTSVTDAGLASLAPMGHLERLHLDLLQVTDGGLLRLRPLKHLEYLNLRGTRVTNGGLAVLYSLPRLRALYVWQTAVTPDAVAALGDSLVDRRRIARWKGDQAELARMVDAERFDGNTGEALQPRAAAPAPAAPEAKSP
jgi:uncharacterized membrane protein